MLTGAELTGFCLRAEFALGILSLESSLRLFDVTATLVYSSSVSGFFCMPFLKTGATRFLANF